MPELAQLRFDDLTLGLQAQFSVLLTKEMVEQFAEISGDKNPLHLDEVYAARTHFKSTIAHGMLVGSFFSRLVGIHLPGRYALYLSQKLNFRKPCRVGMRLLVRGVVVNKTDSARAVTLKTEIIDEKTDECLIDGEAVVGLLA